MASRKIGPTPCGVDSGFTVSYSHFYLNTKLYTVGFTMAFRSSRRDKGKWIPDPPREARRPPIKIPQGDTASLIEEHKLTLIGRSRTLERLDADRRNAYERKQSRSDSSQWQRPTSREPDWKEEKNFRFTYGARRDPNYSSSSLRIGKSGEEDKRRPARERLSFSKEETSSAHMEARSRTIPQNQRTEWRPVASGSQQRSQTKSAQSLVSHTPSPRPQREGGSSLQALSQTNKHNSGEGSLLSNDRRSALQRLSLPTERVPLLQDGIANAASGRLQEVDIHYLEEILTVQKGSSVPSTSRNPGGSGGGAVGGTNLPANSRERVGSREIEYNSTQDRSPIRTLSEDRVHVSLRLGPLFDTEEEDLNLPSAAMMPPPLNTASQLICPMGPTREEDQNMLVSELLMSDSAEWNVNKIKQVLPHYEDLIRKLVPSDCGMRDEL
ncbi:hypothetical protein HID58_042613, partial [Brassica napus]